MSKVELYCNDPPCEACGATPILYRCGRCGIAGLITTCKHSEPNPPISISLTIDFPNMTCDPCERRQEELVELASKFLGPIATDQELTRFRRACNAAIKRKRPPLARYDLSVVAPFHAAEYVWNLGDWWIAADMLLGEES